LFSRTACLTRPAATALETFRRENGDLRDISFPTISAFGEHAAIPHYRVTEKSNLKIGRGVQDRKSVV